MNLYEDGKKQSRLFTKYIKILFILQTTLKLNISTFYYFMFVTTDSFLVKK
jgi:hypothetical protein